MDDNTNLADLGRAIRELREDEGSNEDDLATAADITVEKLGALEAGKLDPDYDLMIAGSPPRWQAKHDHLARGKAERGRQVQIVSNSHMNARGNSTRSRRRRCSHLTACGQRLTP